MHSTPSRHGLSDSNSFTVEAIKPYIRRDVEERFATNELDVAQFVRVVWGLGEKDINTIKKAAREGKISLPKKILDEYKQVLREKEAYEPFLRLATNIFDQSCNILFNKEHVHTVILYQNRGDTTLKSKHSRRKPDALALPANYDPKKKINWKDVLIPFEFKTDTKLGVKGKVLFHEGDTQRGLSLGTPAACSRGSTKSRNPRDGPRRKSSKAINLNASVKPSVNSANGPLRKKHLKGDKLDSAYCADSAPSKKGSPLKRRADDDSHPSPSKRRCSPPRITENQLQLARYALECMAASSRHYVTGVFIDGLNISLWYYDRAIVARTSSFDFTQEIGMLALVVYAIKTCDLRHAGFDSFIIPPSHSPPSNFKELFKIPPSMMQLKGDEIVLFPKNDAVKRFRIDDDGVLFANKGLLGRGTVVFSVVPVGNNSISCEKQVMKILWRQKKRKVESDIIQQLCKAIPDMTKHLPEMTTFVSVTAAELHLPRRLLGFPYHDDWERELIMIALKRYKGLWYAKDVNEFKELFVDCVECHYAAFERGRVLHRDLSVDNLMCADGPEQDGRKRKIGIVSDWDLASFIDDKDEIILSHTTHRTGTVPFMSRELLDRDPPAHKYWHDLESFLYILFWAAVHFDLEKHTMLPTHGRLKSWNNNDLGICSGQKNNFLSNWKEYRDLIRRQNRGLEDWLIALRKLFSGTYSIVLASETEIFDPSTRTRVTRRPVELFEQNITFKSFMATIGRRPRYLYE